jgi:hypothetical protein
VILRNIRRPIGYADQLGKGIFQLGSFAFFRRSLPAPPLSETQRELGRWDISNPSVDPIKDVVRNQVRSPL